MTTTPQHNWPMVRLGDVLQEFTARPTPEQQAGTILTLTEKNGFMRQEDRFNKRLALENTSKYKVIRRGEFALNPYLLWAGAIALNTRFEEGIISPLYPTFRVSPSASAGYLNHLFKTEAMISRFDQIAFGSVPRKRRTRVPDFLSLQIPLPPLEEQHRIAEILDAAISSRSSITERLTTLSQLKHDVFSSMFLAKPRVTTTIGEYLESTQYGTSAKANESTGIPILRMGNITYGGDVDLAQLKYIDMSSQDRVKYSLREGDLLFNRTNSKDLVGKTAVFPHLDGEYTFAGYLVRCRVNDTATPEYVAGFLNSPAGKTLLRNKAKAIVGMANINAKELASTPIPVAVLPEQQEFSRIVRSIDKVSNALRQQLQLADDLVLSLNIRAFQGKL
ncbi:restriction endonuclease subunit S [Corynebacterium lizhenjunii]|uniref:Restriction endonuclease subunit S n=1 Tax=Corynebacterium lizhenjunii TaxID=2709394 RepID=A0A7T0P9W8_9CORY|nr:restriction endonuclease subunit S [Corynebacterium lizhenjunii]QPK79213.1 restriction endonuclease subunit S [Corynebacterium lizhenjunii]